MPGVEDEESGEEGEEFGGQGGHEGVVPMHPLRAAGVADRETPDRTSRALHECAERLEDVVLCGAERELG